MATDDVQKQVRTHLAVFFAVLVLAIMAGVSVIAGTSSIPAVLGIAAVQVLLILYFLMHVRTDGVWIRGLLLFCALFVAVLIGLQVLGIHDRIDGTQDIVITTGDHNEETADVSNDESSSEDQPAASETETSSDDRSVASDTEAASGDQAAVAVESPSGDEASEPATETPSQVDDNSEADAPTTDGATTPTQEP